MSKGLAIEVVGEGGRCGGKELVEGIVGVGLEIAKGIVGVEGLVFRGELGEGIVGVGVGCCAEGVG